MGLWFNPVSVTACYNSQGCALCSGESGEQNAGSSAWWHWGHCQPLAEIKFPATGVQVTVSLPPNMVCLLFPSCSGMLRGCLAVVPGTQDIFCLLLSSGKPDMTTTQYFSCWVRAVCHQLSLFKRGWTLLFTSFITEGPRKADPCNSFGLLSAQTVGLFGKST